jgi:hypothetical protein
MTRAIGGTAGSRDESIDGRETRVMARAIPNAPMRSDPDRSSAVRPRRVPRSVHRLRSPAFRVNRVDVSCNGLGRRAARVSVPAVGGQLSPRVAP